MKKIITIALFATLYGCNGENAETNSSNSISLPGGAIIESTTKIIRDETVVINTNKTRKLSIIVPGTDALVAEQDFYEKLGHKKYNRRITDTGKNSIRVFYSANNEPGIDSYFVGPAQNPTDIKEVRLVLAWPNN